MTRGRHATTPPPTRRLRTAAICVALAACATPRRADDLDSRRADTLASRARALVDERARALVDERARALVDAVAADIEPLAPCLARALPAAPRLDVAREASRDAQVAAAIAWVEQARGHRFAAPPRVDSVSRAGLREVLVRSTSGGARWVDAVARVSDATSDGHTITVVAPAGSAPLPDDALLALVHELDRLLVAPGVPAHSNPGDDAARARLAAVESDATIVTAVFARAAGIHDVAPLVARDARRLAALPGALPQRLLSPYTAALAATCARATTLTPPALDAALAPRPRPSPSPSPSPRPSPR